MSNINRKHFDRKATKASILRFVDIAVLPERGSRDKCPDTMLSKIEGLKKRMSTWY